MNSCSFCGNRNIKKVDVQYTYKHNDKYLLIDKVPCLQCEYCGEQYFEAKVLKQIENEFSDIYSGKKKVNRQILVPIENFNDLAHA
ncbi:MAG: type II toxin-antitoxin system MqsA family antitoxin [Campylobacterota bacterium]|nr:type II toxin-antitoxin system MqsA family antitoxin [Campylobacterota bacterium]